MTSFCIKGDFIHARTKHELEEHPDAYLLVRNGIIEGFVPTPESGMEVLDYSGRLIIPAFTDLHVHASQYPNMGLGMDLPLLPWLEKYTFALEMKYAEPNYARVVYPRFVHALWKNGSLRSCIYATIHREATEILMDHLEQAGLSAYVGKVNMNRNAPEGLTETMAGAAADTRQWLQRYSEGSRRVRPIITPRFVPSVSSELMLELGQLAREFDVPIQSHLNENKDEVAWVRALHPEAANYLDVYDQHDLIRDRTTIMAHSIYNEDQEIEIFQSKGVFLAHCPTANMNMASGIMPAARFLRTDTINMALGSDVAGGHSLFIPRTMVDAMQSSNLLASLDKNESALTLAEAFWMGTRGGGVFFGSGGDFNPGASCDLLVIDDSQARILREMNLSDRLSKFIFAGDPADIQLRMLEGEILPEPRINA